MLPYKRSKRIGDLLREEIADIVMRRVKDPRLGFLTVTSVEVTDDLKIARVYVSVLNKDETRLTLDILTSAKGFIRSELRRRVRMKVIPELEFHEDESIEYGARIDELLERIKREDEGEGSRGTG
ncbi:MAG TPA: 30S ribosome-binding factor RbfA [Nitrospirae bacterium]|nr:30S ribosome-binding factor RbfA [Nitrospirota bacterium]